MPPRAGARLVSAASLGGVVRAPVTADDEASPLPDADTLVGVRDIDPCDWIEDNFWIPLMDGEARAALIRLRLHQKAIIRYIFTRRPDGRFPFQTIVISQPKKSGKTTMCAACIRWLAETQARYADLYCIGNDKEQAKDRSFRFVKESIENTPGYRFLAGGTGRLEGRWLVFATSLRSLTTRSRISAIAVDASGEAGGRPYCSTWTELWGFEHEAARKLWTEMTPVPTVPDSMRIIDSYAGFEGESELLRSLYDRGKDSGRQLTNHELATVAARDVDGERYEDFLHAFAETGGDPDALVPCWVEGRMFMYWDEGEEARRVPEQQTPEYYAEEAKTLDPQEFNRIHLNRWGTSVTGAIPAHWWTACYDETLPPIVIETPSGPQFSQDPMVLSLDAGVSGDCFAVTATTRHPAIFEKAALRALKVWTPADFAEGTIQFEGEDGRPFEFVSWCIAHFNILQVCYDPFQLEDFAQRLRLKTGVWVEAFNQAKDREVADKRFHDMVQQRLIAWNFHDEVAAALMRQHIANANKKVQKDQESKLRFIKKGPERKIDLLVSASMGTDRMFTLVV